MAVFHSFLRLSSFPLCTLRTFLYHLVCLTVCILKFYFIFLCVYFKILKKHLRKCHTENFCQYNGLIFLFLLLSTLIFVSWGASRNQFTNGLDKFLTSKFIMHLFQEIWSHSEDFHLLFQNSVIQHPMKHSMVLSFTVFLGDWSARDSVISTTKGCTF